MTLFEALDKISRDSYAEARTPGELAALIKQWLGNLIDREPYPDSAPLMWRMKADAPGWNRFDYRGSFQQLAVAHYVLRAAESLTHEQDLEPSLNLIKLGREICNEILISSPLFNRPANQGNE
jgi:hypothetical protein